MKKLNISLVIILIISLFTSFANAESSINVRVDGKLLSFDEPPIIIEGRTLVPLRSIFESLGVVPQWDQETSTITANSSDINMILTIDSKEALVNDKIIYLEVPSTIVNGRTMVPARFIADTFGGKVNWDSRTNTVVITTKTTETTGEDITPNHTPQNYTSQTLTEWGLGEKEKAYVSLNRDYDWFIDQQSTGKHSGDNCGPSSAVMAAQWADPNFNETVEEARNMYVSEGGWWFTYDVVDYLRDHSIANDFITVQDESSLMEVLDEGKILILCIDTSYIKRNYSSIQRTGRFYDYEGGHFLVAKGYIIVDESIYFEVYDPNNWGETYADGEEKGKDRYYSSEDLLSSIKNWWSYAIVVESSY